MEEGNQLKGEFVDVPGIISFVATTLKALRRQTAGHDVYGNSVAIAIAEKRTTRDAMIAALARPRRGSDGRKWSEGVVA